MNQKTHLVWGELPEQSLVLPGIVHLCPGERVWMNVGGKDKEFTVSERSHHITLQQGGGTYSVTVILE